MKNLQLEKKGKQGERNNNNKLQRAARAVLAARSSPQFRITQGYFNFSHIVSRAPSLYYPQPR